MIKTKTIFQVIDFLPSSRQQYEDDLQSWGDNGWELASTFRLVTGELRVTLQKVVVIDTKDA